ncbi:hypothetical protein NZD89_05055 [Alicyclobacillus fastidiosus]|uniref:Uncharacterized protein n=1 Tax=Alicyclobacillus fastidiosus TaxID=392011 RepID=A0ABY6ZKS9_9BACL|nr:hypothetical protein [Alicyclobacillus fastidiosus]WAH42801.1 hypothetical protein NZD89_05055 [Alicyclobacillus fastidiosus]GMA64722.1 hypothetical protein GCM10025859_51620 [Alicyclobacillus fastidiosus]
MDEKRVREIVREELRRFLDDLLASSRAGAVEATTACDPSQDSDDDGEQPGSMEDCIRRDFGLDALRSRATKEELERYTLSSGLNP